MTLNSQPILTKERNEEDDYQTPVAPRPSDEEIEFVAVPKEDEKAVMTEKAFLLSQRRRLEVHPTNIVPSKTRLADAYNNDISGYTTKACNTASNASVFDRPGYKQWRQFHQRV